MTFHLARVASLARHRHRVGNNAQHIAILELCHDGQADAVARHALARSSKLEADGPEFQSDSAAVSDDVRRLQVAEDGCVHGESLHCASQGHAVLALLCPPRSKLLRLV